MFSPNRFFCVLFSVAAVTQFNAAEVDAQLSRFRCRFPARAAFSFAPSSIAMVDLNEDGRADFVTGGGIGNFGGELVLHLSRPFDDGYDYTALTSTNSLESIAIGDLNSDGHQDVVAVRGFVGLVHILLGDGTGGGDFVTLTPKFDGQLAVDLGDLDSDGDLDFVVSDNLASELRIFWNDGFGSFDETQSMVTKTPPEWVLTSDLDGDGDVDIATTGGASIGGDVAIFENQGGRVFDEVASLAVGGEPEFIVVADFNQDQLPDLATANRSTNDVSVLINVGGADFATEVRVNTGAEPVALVARDVDSDSDIDLLVTNEASSDVQILENTGIGIFKAGVTVAIGPRPVAIAAGDVDCDGEDEFGIAFRDGDHFQILDLADQASLVNPRTFATGPTPRTIVSADLDGNGTNDIVTGNYFDESISILMNGGDAVFSSPVTIKVGNRTTDVELADLDGDGDTDVAVTHGWQLEPEGFLTIFRNNGDGSVSFNQTISVGRGTTGLVSEDFDDDGDIDIVIAVGGTSAIVDELIILLNEGDGTFVEQAPMPVGELPGNFFCGDINGDGLPDLALETFDGCHLIVNLGSGEFELLEVLPEVSLNLIADVDGDSDLDLVGSSSLFLNNGSGEFAEAPNSSANYARVSCAADLNMDQRIELVSSPRQGVISVLFDTGKEWFSEQQLHTAGISVGDMIVSDLNGDQLPDIAVADEGGNSVVVFPNRCTRLGDINRDGELNLLDVSPFIHLLVDGEFQEEADVNGDGKANLLDVPFFVELLSTPP